MENKVEISGEDKLRALQAKLSEARSLDEKLRLKDQIRKIEGKQ